MTRSVAEPSSHTKIFPAASTAIQDGRANLTKSKLVALSANMPSHLPLPPAMVDVFDWLKAPLGEITKVTSRILQYIASVTTNVR